mgnify:CR=1 FL=1
MTWFACGGGTSAAALHHGAEQLLLSVGPDREEGALALGARIKREVNRRYRTLEIENPKGELQEWLQARKLPVPEYRITATRGQAHAQTTQYFTLLGHFDATILGASFF